MTTQEKHEHIRACIARLGYHVRSQKGFAMSIVEIVTKHDVIEATLSPQFRLSTHDDFSLYIRAA